MRIRESSPKYFPICTAYLHWNLEGFPNKKVHVYHLPIYMHFLFLFCEKYLFCECQLTILSLTILSLFIKMRCENDISIINKFFYFFSYHSKSYILFVNNSLFFITQAYLYYLILVQNLICNAIYYNTNKK